MHDAEVVREIDPYQENNKQIARKYNTEACEQVFAWLDPFCPYLLEMGPGLFLAHMTMMMDRRNAKVVKRRNNGMIDD